MRFTFRSLGVANVFFIQLCIIPLFHTVVAVPLTFYWANRTLGKGTLGSSHDCLIFTSGYRLC